MWPVTIFANSLKDTGLGCWRSSRRGCSPADQVVPDLDAGVIELFPLFVPVCGADPGVGRSSLRQEVCP